MSIAILFQASACNTDTTPTQPHRNSKTHRTKNNTTNVAIEQNSRKLLMTDILMSETCWAHKKWNKIASDIKLVFYSSAVTIVTRNNAGKFVALRSARSDTGVHFIYNVFKYSCKYIESNFILKY